MPDFPEQFREAKSNVEPDAKDVTNASKAHEDVRATLERSEELAAMGIDTILIGSYARHVSIHRMRDVDVFSKLLEAKEDIEPTDLLDTFESVLLEEYGDRRVERQRRSIKIEFPDYDLSVDAVPARPHDGHWEIPAAEGGWEETNPLELGKLSSQMNSRYDQEYVPTVKLVRQVRRAHLGDNQPGGLYLEIATYHSFDACVEADSPAGYLVEALDGVADQLRAAAETGLPDPSLPGKTITTRATMEELHTAADTFRRLATDAQEAVESDEACPSARIFRDLLGKDSDDKWVFPMPSYCNDDGTPRSSATAVVAGSTTIRGGDSRFA